MRRAKPGPRRQEGGNALRRERHSGLQQSGGSGAKDFVPTPWAAGCRSAPIGRWRGVHSALPPSANWLVDANRGPEGRGRSELQARTHTRGCLPSKTSFHSPEKNSLGKGLFLPIQSPSPGPRTPAVTLVPASLRTVSLPLLFRLGALLSGSKQTSVAFESSQDRWPSARRKSKAPANAVRPSPRGALQHPGTARLCSPRQDVQERARLHLHASPFPEESPSWSHKPHHSSQSLRPEVRYVRGAPLGGANDPGAGCRAKRVLPQRADCRGTSKLPLRMRGIRHESLTTHTLTQKPLKEWEPGNRGERAALRAGARAVGLLWIASPVDSVGPHSARNSARQTKIFSPAIYFFL